MISLALSVRAVPVVLALVAPPQPLTNPEAKAKLQEAQAAFKAEDFAAAAAAVEAAYIIEPNPILLYPWAQAERSRGNCAAAVELYQRFLDSEPPEAAATPARENMQRCQEQLEAEAAAQPEEETDVVEEVIEEEPEPEPEPPPVTPKDDEPKAKAWYADPVGGVLVGVGVVGVGVGAGLMGAGASKAGKAADVDSHSAYLDARDQATGLRNGGAIALSIGGALIVGGVVRYVLVAKKAQGAKASAWQWSPELGRRWVGVTIGRRF